MTPKQRGLGRGLDALFEDEEKTFSANEKETATGSGGPRKTLGIGQLTPNPEQPRTYFDPNAINELAESIRQHGLLQPILVRPIAGNPDMYEIVAGERRWRASQKAQLHEVPVIIRDMDDTQVLQIALIENLQRQDLNALEEARGYQKLMEDFGYSAEDIGKSVGRSRSHVANMVRLLQLPESVQTMVVEGKISAGHARALINADKPALIAQEIIAKGLSVRQVEKLVVDRNENRFTPSDKHKKKQVTYKDPNTLALEKDLTAILGLKVTITMADRSTGRLAIDFLTLDQLDDVLLRLSKIPKVIGYDDPNDGRPQY